MGKQAYINLVSFFCESCMTACSYFFRLNIQSLERNVKILVEGITRHIFNISGKVR